MKWYKTRVLKWLLAVVLAGALLYGCCVVVAVLAFIRPTNDRDNRDPIKQKEMLAISLKVGDLAPIPKGATLQTVKTMGNPFTRSFRVVFEADPQTIKTWLKSSNGIKGAQVVKQGKADKYILKPNEGYQEAYILVDSTFTRVTIYTEWS